uniref:Integrator complex subunit 8-like n=1 Tax=Sinocyclocheilus grahami TaxID=75366 RepID=A0A672PIX4_SINGR
MSVEAADREALSCSRPCTPPQASWFEFLLDPSLLEQHLQGPHPDPSPVQLIVQFLEQASKPSVNEQNQVQPPADNRRNRTLKLMALKAAAHLTWDLKVLEKGLTIPVLNMLLNELLCVSRVPPGVKHVDLDLSTLPPTTAMAVLVYNRWSVHYDLGGIYFQQGCSDPSVYEKAREHFRMARELLTKLDSSASFCCVDEQRLAGYWSACKTLTGASDPSESQHTPYGQISCFMRNHDYGVSKDSLTALYLRLYVSFHQLLLKPSKNTISFLLEVCARSMDKEHRSETCKRKMALFIKTVCNRLEDVSLAFMVSSHKLFMELLQDEEKKILMEQTRKSSATVNLSAKPLPSFYDIPASTSVNISQLEQQLILSLDPRHIRQILIELQGMAERPFWRVNSKWEVPVDYVNVILAIKDNLTRDLVYILMAKGLHCISIKDFAHACQLFTACLELVTEFSPKLRQVMLNELLLMEVRGHEAGAAEGNMERPPPDLVSRVRGYLEMRIHDLPLRQIVGEECVVFMLNWRENEYLTLQVPQSLVNSNPYIKLGQLIASTCKELPGPKESRRMAKELWEVVVQICSVSSQHKRSSDGRVSLLKLRESSLGILYYNGKILFLLQSVDVEAVVVTLKELVNYALSLNPNNQSWLCTQADIYFGNQYSAAMHYYLQAGTVCSDYFTKPVPPDVYTDQVLKRMIKCCSLLNCHTQVAVLCQFLREVDYMTAFKALQEQNSHDSMDSFYGYIWDVTILEYLTYIHHKRGEGDKRQVAIKAIGQTELNSSNPEEVLQLAAQKRKKKFLQALAKLYF